jgi:hypothetical protein
MKMTGFMDGAADDIGEPIIAGCSMPGLLDPLRDFRRPYGADNSFLTLSQDSVRHGGLHPGLFSFPPYGRKCRPRPVDALDAMMRQEKSLSSRKGVRATRAYGAGLG